LGIDGCGFLIQAIAAPVSLRLFSPLSDGPTPPPAPFAPWHDAQLALKMVLPLSASPALATVEEAPVDAAADDAAAGAAEALDAADVSVELDVSAGFEQPATIARSHRATRRRTKTTQRESYLRSIRQALQCSALRDLRRGIRSQRIADDRLSTSRESALQRLGVRFNEVEPS
jgi:hypothetical protein